MDETKYFGLKEIKQSAETSDGQTVGILFVDETSANVPKWEFEKLCTDHPQDEVSLRNERANVIAQQILAMLLEADYPANEIGFVLEKVQLSIFDEHTPGSFHRAMNKAVEKATNGLVTVRRDLRLKDINAIINGV